MVDTGRWVDVKLAALRAHRDLLRNGSPIDERQPFRHFAIDFGQKCCHRRASDRALVAAQEFFQQLRSLADARSAESAGSCRCHRG